jgi:D-arabinose 1-dehydrogenase-like Zn-dependent alcohol dehydrogenase
MPDVATATWMRGCIIRGINVGSKQQLDEVVQFVGSTNLQLPVERTFGFEREDVLAAYDYLNSDQHIGKVCIKVS